MACRWLRVLTWPAGWGGARRGALRAAHACMQVVATLIKTCWHAIPYIVAGECTMERWPLGRQAACRRLAERPVRLVGAV